MKTTKQLSDDWIDRQLEACENFELSPTNNYVLALNALQQAQGELRLVFSILKRLLLGMDDLPYKNIKNCIASLVCAGFDWLQERKQDANK